MKMMLFLLNSNPNQPIVCNSVRYEINKSISFLNCIINFIFCKFKVRKGEIIRMYLIVNLCVVRI